VFAKNSAMTAPRVSLLILCLTGCTALAQFQPPSPQAVPPPTGQVENPDGLKAAIAAVPVFLRDGIVKVSADNGTPNPPAWYFIAKTGNGEAYSVTVVDGQVTEQKPSLNLRALFAMPTTINLARLSVGSNGAWAAAVNYAQSKSKTLGSVSYVLEQKGQDAAPVWSIWCYTRDGYSIGYFQLLADTGKVFNAE
jgi:hypothetical protein